MTNRLSKATITALDKNRKESGRFEVQFNPTSLKIERTNPTSGGTTAKAQPRQHANEGHATLTLELEFDTAEGDENGRPLDVRNLTAKLRQFTEPPGEKPQDATPLMRFRWGEFRFDGIVERISEDLDYFDSHGRALRAKVGLTVKEQSEEFARNASGPGARQARNAPRPLDTQAGSGPGAAPSRTPDRALDARAGESVQQALARAGLDPAAWRSAMSGLTSPLALGAGAQLQLDASASVGGGIGISAGFSAGVSAGRSAGASAGVFGGLSLAASASAAAGVTASAGGSARAGGTVGAAEQVSAAFALSAAGGVEAAVRGSLSAAAVVGDAAARASFAVPGSAAAASFSASAGASASGSAHASAATSGAASATVSARPGLDIRATTFGRDVPLKPPPVLR